MHLNERIWPLLLIGAIRKKAAKAKIPALDKQIAWLREMVDWQDETKDSREFLKSLKTDLDPKEVYVFTPKGEAMSLRYGSTPIDFCLFNSYRSGQSLCGR